MPSFQQWLTLDDQQSLQQSTQQSGSLYPLSPSGEPQGRVRDLDLGLDDDEIQERRDAVTQTTTPIQQQPNTSAPSADEPADEPVEQEPVSLVRIRAGATWYRMANPSGTDKPYIWYAEYTIPGTNFKYYFEATQEQVEAIFGQETPATFTNMDPTSWEQHAQDNRVFFGGGISEMEGTESFASAFERAVMSGLGVGTLPASLMDNEEILGLVFLSEQENWVPERLYEEISKTQAFQVRFPHLDKFTTTGLTVSSAVTAMLEYESRVQDLARTILGQELTLENIHSIMAKKHSFEVVAATFNQYDLIQKRSSALAAFNEVLALRGLDPLQGDDLYEFMEGNAEPELYDIYEESAILEAGKNAGIDFLNAAEAKELAAATQGQTGYLQAYQGLSQAAQLILKFRSELDLGQLDPEDLIDLSLGIAPRSGTDQATIARDMERLVRKAQGFVDQRAKPVRSFDNSGTPKAVSISRSRMSG